MRPNPQPKSSTDAPDLVRRQGQQRRVAQGVQRHAGFRGMFDGVVEEGGDLGDAADRGVVAAGGADFGGQGGKRIAALVQQRRQRLPCRRRRPGIGDGSPDRRRVHAPQQHARDGDQRRDVAGQAKFDRAVHGHAVHGDPADFMIHALHLLPLPTIRRSLTLRTTCPPPWLNAEPAPAFRPAFWIDATPCGS